MLKIIQNLEDLESFEKQWNDFTITKEYPLLSYEWVYCCFKHLYQSDAIRIFCLVTNGEIKAIAPFVSIKNFGNEHYEFVGSSILYEPSGFIYYDEDYIETLLNELLEQKTPLVLTRLFNNFEKFRLNKKDLNFRGLIRDLMVSGTPFISTKMGWESYYNHISSRRKYDLRRAQKKAKEIGEVHFEIIPSQHTSIKTYLQKAFEIENSGWKGKAGSSILQNKNFKNFFMEYLYKASLQNMLQLLYLKINTQYVAMMICLIYNNKLWVLKIGYDEKFAECSPGILLLFNSIQYTFEENLEGLELLGTESDWLKVWSTETKKYRTIVLYPYSIKGISLLMHDSASYVKKKVFHS